MERERRKYIFLSTLLVCTLFFRVRDGFPFLFFVYIWALFYLLELAMIRTEFKEESPSPFETHGGLMMISYVALFVAALTSGILLYTRKYLQNSRWEAILGCISFYSGFLASTCLVLVFGLPKNMNWIGYLVVAVTFVIAIGCYFIGNMWLPLHRKEDVYIARPVIHEDRTCSDYSTTLLPLPIVLVLFVPDNLNWIQLWVDGAAFLIVIAYNMIVYLKSVKVKEERNLKKLIKVTQ